MRSTTTSLLVFLLLGLMGCVTSGPVTTQRFDSEGVTTFKTSLLDMGIDPLGSNLGSAGRILYQIRARCEGADCVPSDVVLSFFLDSGFNTVYLADRNLTIKAGGERYHWEKQSWLDLRNSPPVLGRIIAVTLDLDQLENIAQAETVTGKLASKSFEWSYQNRKPLRSLLNKMRGNS